MKKIEEQDIEKLKSLYRKVAEITKPKCAGEGLGACRPKQSCCDGLYCDLAEERASHFGITLQTTDNQKLKYMGPEGCTVDAYLRPICAIHVCERAYTLDQEFANKYFALREEIDLLEWDLEKYLC